MTELDALEADIAVVAHDLDLVRGELACAFEQLETLENRIEFYHGLEMGVSDRLRRRIRQLEDRVARLENAHHIYEFQNPTLVRINKLERAFKVLAENPGSPHYAARAALEIIER